MKAITILEPWASLIACGRKKVETRGWNTNYRGIIAIHAAKSSRVVDRPHNYKALPAFLALMYQQVHEEKKEIEYMRDGLNLGCIIATAKLIDCKKVIKTIDEKVGKYIAPNNKIILEDGTTLKGYDEYRLGDFTPGRYAWILKDIKKINPVPARGQQGLWNWRTEND